MHLLIKKSFAFGLACLPITISAQKSTLPVPPNTVLVAPNLFADQTEITNLDWKEYEYWHKHVFGDGSAAHLASLPDTTVWRTTIGYSEPFVGKYYRHAAYESFPVVGITQQQAHDYCRWRSDRYFEMLLIKEGVIEFNKNQNSENYFTIQGFFAGEIPLKKSNTMPSTYPIYALPNREQYNQMMAHNNKLGLKPKNQSATSPTNGLNLPGPVMNDKNLLKKKYLFYLTDNVAEWAKEPGVVLGETAGGEPMEDLATDLNISSLSSSAVLGLRCVCQWAPNIEVQQKQQ